MKFHLIIILIIFLACATSPASSFVPPPTKLPSDPPSSLDKELLTEYDIWGFLKNEPSEKAVIEMLGAPDSVWVSDEQPYYIIYYFRSKLNDYNSIEFNTKTRKVTGYEWDE